MTIETDCPYCGEPLTLEVDEYGGRRQSYVEDCAVCCRPIEVQVSLDGEQADLVARRQDE